MKVKIWFWIFFLASAVLFFSPLQVQEKTGLGLDKLVHVALFTALVVAGLAAYKNYKTAVIMSLLVYTFLTEIIQGNFVPHRSFDIFDIVSDSVGIMIGVFILSRRLLHPSRNRDSQ